MVGWTGLEDTLLLLKPLYAKYILYGSCMVIKYKQKDGTV